VGERGQRVVEERAVFRNEVVGVEGMGKDITRGAALLEQYAHERMGGGLVMREVAGDRLKQRVNIWGAAVFFVYRLSY
jgi:hypothetical protein